MFKMLLFPSVHCKLTSPPKQGFLTLKVPKQAEDKIKINKIQKLS